MPRTSCSSSAPIDPQWDTRTFYVAPDGLPARAASATVDQDRAIIAVRGEGHVAGRRRTSASTRRSSAIRRTATNGPQRYTALLAHRHVGVQRARQVRRPQPDGEIRRRRSARTGCVEASFARAANNIVEMPSVDQWTVTDDTVTPHDPSAAASGSTRTATRARTGSTRRRRPTCIGRHQLRYGVDVREHRLRQHDQPHRARRSRCRTASRRRRAPRSRSCRIPGFGQIYRVDRAPTRATCATRRSTTATSSCRTRGRSAVDLTINPGVRYEQQTLDRHARRT